MVCFMQMCVFLDSASCVCVCGAAGFFLTLSPSLSLPLFLFHSSHQVVFFEVELQDGVFDGCKDEADVLCVSGACEMGVDDLVTVWVQVHKHLQDELPTRLGVPLGTWEEKRLLLLACIEHLTSIISFYTDPFLTLIIRIKMNHVITPVGRVQSDTARSELI